MALFVTLPTIFDPFWPGGEEEDHENDSHGYAHGPEDPDLGHYFEVLAVLVKTAAFI